MDHAQEPIEAPESPTALAGAGLDTLLRELLTRVEGLGVEQDRMRLLLDTVVGLSSDLDVHRVLRRIVEAAGTLVTARYAALGVLADDGETLGSIIQHGMSDDDVDAIGRLPVGKGLLGAIVRADGPVRLADLTTSPHYEGLPDGHPALRALLGVQVRTPTRVLGALYLAEKTTGGEFTQEDEAVVVALASAASVAMENARLYEESRKREEWLEATAAITGRLLARGHSDEALQTVADRAREVSRADVAWVVAGTGADDLHLQVVAGAQADFERMRALPMRRSLARHVVLTGETVAVEDLASDPRAFDVAFAMDWPRVGPIIMLPLTSGTGVQGVLALAWSPDRKAEFHAVDPTLPTRFAAQAALALQVNRSREDQQRLAVLEDRDRIARDLHDLVIQRLFAVCLGLQSTARRVPDKTVVDRLEQAVDDLDATIKDVRRSIFALGSVQESADVQTEITRLVDRAQATLKFRPQLTLEGPVRTLVPDELAPDLIAVLGEALSNASRHAGANMVQVTVQAGSELVLTVTDDGGGLPDGVAESGLGNMRERAARHGGSFEITSTPGSGTVLVWRVPLADVATASGD